MKRPRIAVFDFACCEGCQLQFYNLDEELLELLKLINPVEWREAMSDQSDTYDVAIIEGSITRQEDEERIKEIRSRAGVLIALGACATIGGVNRIKNLFTMDDVRKTVYGADAGMPHLDTYPTRAVGEVVKVDINIHGCPVDHQELARILRALLTGQTPVVPNYPVCVECKKREIICRYEYNEICLGPMIRAGCNAACPAAGFWCFGCRGLLDDPNLQSAHEIMSHYGKTPTDLLNRLQLFNADTEQKQP